MPFYLIIPMDDWVVFLMILSGLIHVAMVSWERTSKLVFLVCLGLWSWLLPKVGFSFVNCIVDRGRYDSLETIIITFYHTSELVWLLFSLIKYINPIRCHESMKAKVKVARSCLTLCSPMDYTVYGILQTRILEWVAIPFPRGSSQPRN